MTKETSKQNPKGQALFNVLAEATEAMTFAEMADKAGVEAKTGYLTAAKKVAKDQGREIVKVEEGCEYTLRTIKTFKSGLVVETEKTVKADGYLLK